MWDYSEPKRVRWGTVGSMPTNFGNLPKVRERQEASFIWVSQYWQVASVAGKVPKLVKVPEPKHRAIARCEVCVSIYITYILVSKSTPLAVTGPHGQLTSVCIIKQLVDNFNDIGRGLTSMSSSIFNN